MKLENYAQGKWISGDGDGQALFNAITGEEITTASSKGLDFGEMMNYARKVGGPALRKLTFQERGLMLKALAIHLQAKKEQFYKVSWATGATRTDSWVDIEGGIGNLFTYASLRRQFPNETFCLDGDTAKLSKNGTFIGHHICVPKEGVAIHINAFNFPVWGMLEKIAVNLLAGVPAIVKPATVTSFLTEAVVKEIAASKILPEGALQLICGSANGILDYVESQDIVTFTGSASTGMMLKSHPRLIQEAVPFNMEADSLNCCVLGTDAVVGTLEFDIFIKEVQREMTTKAGQKCTAIRRIIVPENLVEDVQIALGKRLATTIIGDPNVEGVRMGALAGKSQLKEVAEKVMQLSKTQEIVFGDMKKFEVTGADKNKGAFMSPILFLNKDPFKFQDCHNLEAFGPVSTIMPYKTISDAIELAKMGKGSLVCSIVTGDDRIAKEFVIGAACMHGRILVLNADCAKESTGHGSPMPLLTHGGPGRAGGGEEMGGKRGVFHYLQRTAIQGSPTTLTNITNNYQYGGKYSPSLTLPEGKGSEAGYMTADPILYKLLKTFVLEHRKNSTVAESILWNCLKGDKLDEYHFRRQHIIGSYIADFVCLKKKLVIEVDGLIHQLPENREKDEIRTQWLTEKGFKVIRFENSEIITNIESVIKQISDALKVLPFGEDLGEAIHPFKRYFEELIIGETLITAKHKVTLENIEAFAELSGDKFYAHMDANSLEGTIFTGRVAHGYYILSRAAGLFVDAPKGPVLLNYGIDECRFTKPVYPGAEIGVRFTCKEKIDQEKKSEEDIAKGIVKWLVDVYDETGETVAIATILTMVKKKNQD